MKTTPSGPSRPRLGTLDEFLAPEDIVPFRILSDEEWNTIRRAAGGQLAWRFATVRNLWVHRGRIVPDAIGFAWAASCHDPRTSSARSPGSSICGTMWREWWWRMRMAATA
jgi:hypothetical protein